MNQAVARILWEAKTQAWLALIDNELHRTASRRGAART